MRRSDSPAPQAKTKLAPNGRIVIPAEIRRALGFAPGETLVMEVVDGTLRIETYRARIHRIQEEFSKLVPPGHSVVDEFIAERHQEALLEREDFERARELRRIRDGYQSPNEPGVSRPIGSRKSEDRVA